MASVQEIVDRLSQYDKTKYPPDSPPVIQKEENKPTDGRTSAEVDEIVNRLCQFDNKQVPPGSTAGRQHLPYNRFDYYHGPDRSVQSKQVSGKKLEEILSRLRTPYERHYHGGKGIPDMEKDIRDEAEVQEIFERLGKFDKKRGPPGSNGGRVDLGYNRYDYGAEQIKRNKGPFRSQAEVDEIISRLTAFDITKYPPSSRGHEKNEKKK